MKTLTLNIEDSVFDEFLHLIKSNFSSMIDIVEDDLFTEEDEAAYQKGVKELTSGEAIY